MTTIYMGINKTYGLSQYQLDCLELRLKSLLGTKNVPDQILESAAKASSVPFKMKRDEIYCYRQGISVVSGRVITSFGQKLYHGKFDQAMRLIREKVESDKS